MNRKWNVTGLIAILALVVGASMAKADNAKGAGDLLRPQTVLILQ